MSLLFNMLSRLVITFLPRSKHFLISWLRSPSAVIFETKEIKSFTVSIVATSICHEVMGPDPMIFVFGSRSLLQEISPIQGLNPGLPHCKWILYQLSHQGSPGILKWVACPFSSGSSWPRSWIRVSCIAGGFFTSWAPKEAQEYWSG